MKKQWQVIAGADTAKNQVQIVAAGNTSFKADFFSILLEDVLTEGP